MIYILVREKFTDVFFCIKRMLKKINEMKKDWCGPENDACWDDKPMTFKAPNKGYKNFSINNTQTT